LSTTAPEGGQVWAKKLANGDQGVILYNNGTATVDVAITWDQLGWSSSATVSVRDLWARKDVGVFSGGLTRTIASHDVFFFRATKN
jgi:alpha-galactosidase